MKKFFVLLSLTLLAFSIVQSAFADLNPASVVVPVNAERNAYSHNRRGVDFYNEHDYYAALKEFKLAVSLNPNSQASAVYYNNLGKVYLIFGEIQKRNHLSTANGGDFSEMARVCFEKSIMQDCMKLEYYKNLAYAYELLGIANQKKAFLKSNLSKNPFNAVLIAVIAANHGQNAEAISLLKNFTAQNSDVIIAEDVKKYIKTLED